jgi:hypothetical protein
MVNFQPLFVRLDCGGLHPLLDQRMSCLLSIREPGSLPRPGKNTVSDVCMGGRKGKEEKRGRNRAPAVLQRLTCRPNRIQSVTKSCAAVAPPICDRSQMCTGHNGTRFCYRLYCRITPPRKLQGYHFMNSSKFDALHEAR